MKHLMNLCVMTCVAAAGCLLAGCVQGRPEMMPNPDPALRLSSVEFAVAASKRVYPAGAPRGGEAVARSQSEYGLNRLEIVNLSDEPWTDVELWVNQKYSVKLPKMEPKVLKRMPFEMLYDQEGHYFPVANSKFLINRVEILREGKLYNVKNQLAD